MVGISVVACFPALILGLKLSEHIPSIVVGIVLTALIGGGTFYLVRQKPNTALILPISVTALFLLGWLVAGSGRPDPKDLKIAQKEGKRHDALEHGKAVGQCRDKWERGLSTEGTRDIFRQAWWDMALKPNLDLASTKFEDLASTVTSCLESSPSGLSKRQATLAFDPNLGLMPIQLSDIHTTIDIGRGAFALAQKKVSGTATPDELATLSVKIRQLDSIGRDPLSTPNTRIGKIPGTGLGM